MWELDCEESWVPKSWCFWTVVLEKTLESPLDCKEIQPVHSEGDQPWEVFARNDAKAETPVLWPPHAKGWLIGKDFDAGRDLGQEEKGTTEDEVAGWNHWLYGCESEWTPGDGDGQGGLACCNSWGCKESETTEWLNWTELNSSGGWKSKIKRPAGFISLQNSMGDSMPCLFLLSVTPSIAGLCVCMTSTSASIVTRSYLWLLLTPSLLRVKWFRVHLGNLGWYHLKSLAISEKKNFLPE